MVAPSGDPSARRHTGRPSSTAATSELVVPRSMPTARVVPGVAQASLTRDWPGSAISNSASTGIGDRLLEHRHLVQEALEVTDLDQPGRDPRDVAGGEAGRDLAQRRVHAL